MRLTKGLRNLCKMLDTKTQGLLDKYAGYNPSPLTIQQFIEFGRNNTEQESFNFLRTQIPTRLANIMKEISLLPGNLLNMESVLILQVNDAIDQDITKWSSVSVCLFQSDPSLTSRPSYFKVSQI